MNSREILEDLLKINAPSKRELFVSNYIKDFAIKNKISFKEFNNLIPYGGNASPLLFKIKGNLNKQSILLSAHMDSVEISHNDEIEIVKDGFIYKSNKKNVLGGDDRLGVAIALLIAKKAIENPNKHSGIEILFSVQEELGCLSTKIFDFSVIDSKINYNLDGEGAIGSIINKAPTKAKYKLKVIGKSSHAALSPEEGNNAIVALSKIITKLPQGIIDEGVTTNIGIISGGNQTNVVAQDAFIVAELRSLNFEKYLKWKEKISNIINFQANLLGVKYELQFDIIYKGYHIDEKSDLIINFKKGCEKNNLVFSLLTSQGGGDSNNINDNNIKSVVFGLSMHNIHTIDEYFDIRDYEKAYKLLDSILFI